MFAEQLSNAAKASFESQLAAANNLSNKAFASVAQLIDLNVNTARISVEQATAAMQQLLAAKDPQEFFTLSAAQAQPRAEAVLSYTQNLAGIASAAQAEFTRATEVQIAEAARKVIALVDEMAKTAPAGSENAITLLKSVISNANASYEKLSQSARQATEIVEENIGKATKQFAQAAEKTASRAKK
jgi:phasin family protein